MTHQQLVIRGDWRGFALCLEPAGGCFGVFNTLTGVSRAMEKGDAVLRAIAVQPKTFLKEKI